MDFDKLYIQYSCAYAYGMDLEKELKKLEKLELYELCHVIQEVLKDQKIIESK